MAEYRDLTSTRYEFYTYRLGRSLLDRIFSVASEGFSPEKLKFSTERSGTSLRRPTFDELVSAVAESPLPGDRNEWENISFSAIENGRHIAIEIQPLWLSISVSGEDATWVHGQSARLRSIVEPVAGTVRPSELRARTARNISLVGGSLSWVAALLFAQASTDHVEFAEAVLGATVVASTVALIIFLVGTSGKGKKKTFINVTDELPNRRWHQELTMADRIAMGTLVTTALAVIAAFISAYADLWGDKK